MVKVRKSDDGQFHQGDILQNVDCIEYADIIDGYVTISKMHYPHAVILSQECDLTQDYSIRGTDKRNDKFLPNVMIAPAFNYEHFRTGTHLSNMDYVCDAQFQNQKRAPAKNLKGNNNPRYHYLEFDEKIPIVPLVVDFKRFFTLNLTWLYERKEQVYLYSLKELYREDMVQRFASFLSRIGLPE